LEWRLFPSDARALSQAPSREVGPSGCGGIRIHHDGEPRRFCRSVCNRLSDRPHGNLRGRNTAAGGYAILVAVVLACLRVRDLTEPNSQSWSWSFLLGESPRGVSPRGARSSWRTMTTRIDGEFLIAGLSLVMCFGLTYTSRPHWDFFEPE
jgi:hypothetical protein